jgi:hypothetical protein
MNRILTTVIAVILTFGSLITFPEHLPWMVFMWLTLALFAFTIRQPMWPWLLACVVIISIKRPGFTIEFWVLAFAFAAIGFIEWRFRRKHDNSLGLKLFGVYAVLLVAAATFFAAMRWFGATARSCRPEFGEIPRKDTVMTAYIPMNWGISNWRSW